MDRGIRYSDEFKQEAFNQLSVHDYSVAAIKNGTGSSSLVLYTILSDPYAVR
ncbi:hypothetical protein [Idiomarina xiamenensis]|uniref:hypothetical protein n=1 Tax=Idiomarina xiamenensis TaxID=1207041 RepID=UPI0012EA533B|nr:hypothetical protein [Idiomarina xiamenensis]